MDNYRIASKQLFLLPVVFLCFSANPVIASRRQLVYEHIDVKMTLNLDTSVDVVETQRVRLSGDWNGLYRYYTLYGCDGIEVIGVSENNTAYERGSVSRKARYSSRVKKARLMSSGAAVTLGIAPTAIL